MILAAPEQFTFPNLISFRPSLSAPRRLGPMGSELRQALVVVFERTKQRSEGEIAEGRIPEILKRLFEATLQAQSEGILVLPDAFVNARVFTEFLPEKLPLPEVVVESRDEIGLDWDEGLDKVVSLTIDSDNQIGFSALIQGKAQHGSVGYTYESPLPLPEKIRSLLWSLYPSAFE